MATSKVTARKNVETDNPRIKGNLVPCKVLKGHIMAEFAELYEGGGKKNIKPEHWRKPDDFLPYMIEKEEAYALYVEGYVKQCALKDPRPRAALKPFITETQLEAALYLKKLANGEECEPPDFVKEQAKLFATKKTKKNRAAIVSAAIGGNHA